MNNSLIDDNTVLLEAFVKVGDQSAGTFRASAEVSFSGGSVSAASDELTIDATASFVVTVSRIEAARTSCSDNEEGICFQNGPLSFNISQQPLIDGMELRNFVSPGEVFRIFLDIALQVGVRSALATFLSSCVSSGRSQAEPLGDCGDAGRAPGHGFEQLQCGVGGQERAVSAAWLSRRHVRPQSRLGYTGLCHFKFWNGLSAQRDA